VEFILDPKPMVTTMPGRQHRNNTSPNLELSRRRLLQLAVSSFVGAQLPGGGCFTHNPHRNLALLSSHRTRRRQTVALARTQFPGSTKNGNRNQSPMPTVELSNIYHFKGKLARCNGFHRMGTDNKGNRLAWGTPTTDYSYMAGEYWAARQAHQAIFAHT
jgi:hypothetical protein